MVEGRQHGGPGLGAGVGVLGGTDALGDRAIEHLTCGGGVGAGRLDHAGAERCQGLVDPGLDLGAEGGALFEEMIAHLLGEVGAGAVDVVAARAEPSLWPAYGALLPLSPPGDPFTDSPSARRR